jgi:hypothetical protein
VSVTCVEVYDEKIRDLLGNLKELDLSANELWNAYPLTKHQPKPVVSAEELLEWFQVKHCD